MPARRKLREEHQARVLATFNQPNIATIHGIEEAVVTDAVAPERRLRALVMELVDGEMAERLCRGNCRWRGPKRGKERGMRGGTDTCLSQV